MALTYLDEAWIVDYSMYIDFFSIVLLTVCLFIPCVTLCCCLYCTALLYLGQVACPALTLSISVFYIFWLGQGVTRVGTLGFCMSRVFCMPRGFVCLCCLNWFPIRDSCLTLSLIGDHI